MEGKKAGAGGGRGARKRREQRRKRSGGTLGTRTLSQMLHQNLAYTSVVDIPKKSVIKINMILKFLLLLAHILFQHCNRQY